MVVISEDSEPFSS